MHLEPFAFPNGWQRGSASGQFLTPVVRPLHIESLGWSPSTPAGGLKGEVVVVSDLHGDKLKEQASQFKGRIVLIDASKAFAGGFAKAFALIKPAWAAWKEAGALGVLLPDRENNNVLNAHDLGWGGELTPLPGGEIGMEDASLMLRLLEKGLVTVAFTLDNQTSGPIQVNNVIAEIRGSEVPNEWVLVGAHLDCVGFWHRCSGQRNWDCQRAGGRSFDRGTRQAPSTYDSLRSLGRGRARARRVLRLRQSSCG